MSTRRFGFLFASLALAFAAGCQAILGIDDTTFEPGGPSNEDSGTIFPEGGSSEGGIADSGGASFAVASPFVRVQPGSSADVEVTLTRRGLGGDVTFDLDGLDAGVSAASVTIPDEATTGTLHVVVASSTPPGTDLVARVHASYGEEHPLEIIVPGAPGTLDTSFAHGEAAFALGDAGAASYAEAVGIQSDGHIIVGARPTGPGPATGWAVLRLDTTGTRDATFDTNAAAAMPATGTLNDLAIGPNDDVFAVGTASDQLTVVHLNADGSRDNLFGTNGVASLSPVSFSQGTTGTGIAVQSDGRPVAVGVSKNDGSIVVRFAKSGLFDTGFTVHVPSSALARVRVLGDDSLVFGGTDSSSGGAVLTGTVPKDGNTFETTSGASPARSGADVGFLADAGVIAVGRDFTSIGRCEVALFPRDGGSPLEADPPMPESNNASCGAVAVQPDGRFLVTGNGGGSYNHTTWVRRMTSPSLLDPTFGDGGVVFAADHSMPSSIPYRYLVALAIEPDGRIVAAGNQADTGIFIVRIWP